MSTEATGFLPSLSDLYADTKRDAQIDTIHRHFVETGVKHIYFQYVTLQGRVLAKVIPTEFWPKAARLGISLAYVVPGGFHVTIAGEIAGEGGIATLEGLMLPDLDTVTVLAWDAEVVSVFCSHYRRLEDTDGRGDPVLTDTRQLLRRELNRLHHETGLVGKSGCEPEMSWFKGPDAVDASASHLPEWVGTPYHVRHLEDVRPVLKKVTEYASAMGFSMIQADYEDPGQLECNFAFDGFLATADRIVIYRQICMQVAEELGIVATFMPKPVPKIMGNGCHHHVSFWEGDRNVMVDEAATGRDNFTPLGRQAVAGLLTHAPGMMALVASTVNSYKRFAEVIWSPTHANWGYDNRACAIRAVNGRFEYRLPDASVNPYLSHLAILAAVRDGWKRQLDPGPPQVGLTPAADSEFGTLPMTLGDAVDRLEADQVLVDTLGPELTELYVLCKRDEWHRFCGAITDWDLASYLNYVP